jgi:hypothetical protein
MMIKLDSAEEIAVPIARVFEEVSDFERLERSAVRRGAEVTRSDDLAGPCVGMTWRLRITLAGRRRDLTLRLLEHAPPDAMLVSVDSADIEARMRVALTALAPARTRIGVTLDVAPRTLAGRLLLKSVRLAGRNLEARFRKGLANYALDVEDRAARGR